MSFSIIIQTNKSSDESLDKELVNIVTLTGTLRDSSSIIDPVIVIEKPDASINFQFANYMTIDYFGRSYFITDIINIRTYVWEIHAHVDVLSSFKLGIRSNFAIINRQEFKYNLYLNDGIFKTYQNPMVLTKKFPSGFTTREFVLAVSGG